MSNGASHHTPASLASDLRRIVGACLTVIVIILLSMAVTTTGMKAFVPRDLLVTGAVGKPADIVSWTSLFTFQALTVLLLVVVVRRNHPAAVFYILALGPPRVDTSAIVRTFAATALPMALFSLITYLFFRAEVVKDLNLFKTLLDDTPIWIPLLVLCVGAPLSEELLFRGYLLGRLSQTRLGFASSAVLATLGWTLLHYGYSAVGLAEVFLAGLLFSWALWRTGSLWVPIVFHAIYNAIVLAVISSLALPAPT